ncbi:MAG: FG-GAP-like repeat-containing protein, partial [Thermoguttaceae bacterium]|nr:FG-GAP-like repeat-containing protein [Thermoguttaceae bacterium]
AAAGLLLAVAGLGYLLVNRPRANPGQESARSLAPTLPPASTDRAAAEPPREVVESLCSSCHLLPSADLEPKALWPDKIEQMYEYMRGPRPIPAHRIPPIGRVISYWASRAPAQLPVPDSAAGSPPSPVPFTPRFVTLDAVPGMPAIANVKFVSLGEGAPRQLLLTEMRWGLVILWTPSRPDEPAVVIGRVPHPCRTSVVDLDGDGRSDILVANLGTFFPADTDKGSVEWLRNRGGGRFERITLMQGLGRVADVAAGDFDRNGRLSLVVAEYGSLTTGKLLYLENCTTDWSHPDFEAVPLDYHTGTSDVKPVDLNGDGCLDFIAMQSQESEHVFAMLNRGRGTFRQETLYRAPHPRWGSTGIVLCDLNGDGRTDVLWNHGDSVDLPPVLWPWHGVSWLENQGKFPFVYHRLTHYPGAHTSVPADLDGDGLLDVVSSALIPAFNPGRRSPFWPPEHCDSVIWLRQCAPGKFERYCLESGFPFHPCLETGDLDGDGDVDLVLGNFAMFAADENAKAPCLTILENGLRGRATPNKP